MAHTDTAELEHVLAITGHEGERLHTVTDPAAAIFTWDYEKGARPALEKLYERAKASQWNGATDLDWSTDVDLEHVAREITGGDARAQFVRRVAEIEGSP